MTGSHKAPTTFVDKTPLLHPTDSNNSTHNAEPKDAKEENPSNATRESSYKGNVLVVTALAAFGMGINYTWSVIVQPIQDARPNWWKGTPVLAQSLMVMFSGFWCFYVGQYVARVGPRKPMVIGGVLFIIGFVLMSLSISYDQEWLYYVSLSAVISTSLATANVACIQYCVRWHPKIRGFAGGFFGTSLGIGSVCLTQVENALVDMIGVSKSLLVLAVIGVVWICMSFFMYFPPKPEPVREGKPQGSSVEVKVEENRVGGRLGDAKEGFEEENEGLKNGGLRETKKEDNRMKVLKKPVFWWFYCTFTIALMPGWGFASSFVDIFKYILDKHSETDENGNLALTLTTAIIAVYTGCI